MLVVLSCGLALTLVLALWGARAFARTDDAMLPERWAAHVQRTLVVLIFSFATLTTFLVESPLLVTPPLAFVSIAGALYPARRRVFEETWSLPSYVRFQLRLFIAFGMFPIGLALLPEVVRLVPGPRAAVAAGVGAAVLALFKLLNTYYARVIGATPLDRPELEAAFEPVLSRARCARPKLYVIALQGGRFVNAIALPSKRVPSVLFGGTLIEHFEPDELAAVLGHELAHLEHHDRAYLRRLNGVVYALVLAGAALVPVVEALAPRRAHAATLTWAAAILVAWFVWMVSRKSHEADSDVRAIELCGDGEALIRALTKLHALARLPKRVTAAVEESASHPSLQRRVERLRAAMGQAPAPVSLETLVVRDANARETCLLVSSTHVRMLRGVPEASASTAAATLEAATSVEAVTLADVVSLSLVARGRKSRLVATDRSGRTFEVEVAAEQVPAVQAALDALDASGALVAGARTPPRPAPWTTLVAGIALTAINATTDPPLFFSLLALCLVFSRGHRPALHAAIAACGTYVVVGLSVRGHAAWPFIAALGAALAAVAWRARVSGKTLPAAWPLVIALGLVAVPSALATLLIAASPLALHRTFVEQSSPLLAMAALAAALASGSRARRVASAALGAVALLALIAMTPWYAAFVVREPLLEIDAPRIQAKPADATVWRRVQLEGFADLVEHSPSGRWALIERASDDDAHYDEAALRPPELMDLGASPKPTTHTLGLAPRDRVTFIDDDRLLLLEPTPEVYRLSVVRLADRTRETSIEIPHGKEPSMPAELGYALATGRYWIYESHGGQRKTTRLSGKLGAQPDLRSRHDLHIDRFRAFEPPTPTQLALRYHAPAMSRSTFAPVLEVMPRLLGANVTPFTIDLVAATPNGDKRLLTTRIGAPRCIADDPLGRMQVCLMPGGDVKNLVRIDASSGAITPIAALPEDVFDLGRHGATVTASSMEALYVIDRAKRTSHVLKLASMEPGCFPRVTLLSSTILIARSCATGTSFEWVARP